MRSNPKMVVHLGMVVIAIIMSALSFPAFAKFWDYDDNPMKPCLLSLDTDPKFESLKKNFRSKEAVFVRYADTSKPTQSEKVLIAERMKLTDACRNSVEAKKYRQDNDSIISSIYESSYSTWVGLVARLYNGEISYGEYHKLDDKQNAEHEERSAARREQIQIQEARNSSSRNAQALQEAALAEQQAAAQEARRERIRREVGQEFQRAYQPIQRPATTNCSTYGGQTSCVTR